MVTKKYIQIQIPEEWAACQKFLSHTPPEQLYYAIKAKNWEKFFTDSLCNVDRNSSSAFWPRHRIRVDWSRRHPSSIGHRSNLATWPSALATHLQKCKHTNQNSIRWTSEKKSGAAWANEHKNNIILAHNLSPFGFNHRRTKCARERDRRRGGKNDFKIQCRNIYVKITYTHDLHIYYLPPQNIDIPYFPSAFLFTCHSVRSFSLRSGQPVKSKYYYKKKQNSNSYLDSFWSDTAVSCSRGIFCSRACMASWADDFRIPASMSHTWNSNRTAFWTFYCHRWRGMVHACHGHPIISHRHMRTKFPVGQPLHVSISFAKIAHRSCDCGLVWLVWANGGSEGQQKNW